MPSAKAEPIQITYAPSAIAAPVVPATPRITGTAVSVVGSALTSIVSPVNTPVAVITIRISPLTTENAPVEFALEPGCTVNVVTTLV